MGSIFCGGAGLVFSIGMAADVYFKTGKVSDKID